MCSTPCQLPCALWQWDAARRSLLPALGILQRQTAGTLRHGGTRVLAIHRHTFEGMEGLPGHPLWVGDPILIGAGIATGCPGLLDEAGIGRFQLAAHGF